MKTSLIILLLLVSLPALAFQNDEKLQDQNQEAQAEHIFKEIRCLVCKGESLAESNADLAVDMRNLIREKIKAGQGDSEIKNYLVSRYGETILQKPPFEEKTYVLWLAPAAILLVGLIIILQKTRFMVYFKKNKKNAE